LTISTEQEAFWQGNFGNEYTERNTGPRWIAANSAFFSNVLTRTRGVRSILELGSNIGLNLIALARLLPEAALSAVEINEKAAAQLVKNVPNVGLHLNSILEFKTNDKWDLVFTKGVLIHVNPDRLSTVYSLMHQCTSRYILVSEYYNPNPIEVVYRGHAGKLFKRDFAGEIMDRFADVKLVDYGFSYHRDPNFPQDDMNWFLMEKR
jgi:pseudaminic acid biosynthesis-associated methylase